MRQKAVETADELRAGLKPGGNETFTHSSPRKNSDRHSRFILP
jgi:hypothetical protein